MKRLAMLALSLAAIGLIACGGDSGSSTTSAETDDASKIAQVEAELAAEAKAEAEAPTEKGYNAKAGTVDGVPLMDDGIFDATVRYAANPERGRTYAYYITEASANPGKISFEFVNPQTTPHNVALEAPNGETIGETKTIGQGVTKSHFVVKKGIYTLYCSVPGHRKKGMLGHLTVQ